MSGQPLNLEGDIVELTRAICDIESVSGNEKELADAIESALAKYSHLEVIRDGDAIIARTNFGHATRVVIAGHIDTVPLAGNLPVKLLPMEREQVLWGRGTVDMKAGVAVQLKLAATLDKTNTDVTWIFYDHEEVDASLNGLGRIARNRPDLLDASFAVLCEPSYSQVEGGCNGTMRADIITRGLKAHSARAWMGKNAVQAAADILNRLETYETAEVEVDGLIYRNQCDSRRVHRDGELSFRAEQVGRRGRGAHPCGVRRSRGCHHRFGRRRATWIRSARGGRFRRCNRFGAETKVWLDRRCPLQCTRHSRGELRPGRPEQGALR
jgi:succinyl-diaminopimelate desuccinylase